MSRWEKGWKSYSAEKIPSTLRLFSTFFKFIKPEDKVLDIGCGYGRVCIQLYKKGFRNVFGIDLNENGINYARKELTELGLNDALDSFKVADALKNPFGDSLFDCVITNAFWVSILPDERKKIMGEISRVLKKGGYLYLSEYGQNWHNKIYRKRYEEGAKKGYERGSFEHLGEDGKLRYLVHHYTKNELVEMLQTADLKLVYYSSRIVVTQSGNKITGHLIIARK